MISLIRAMTSQIGGWLVSCPSAEVIIGILRQASTGWAPPICASSNRIARTPVSTMSTCGSVL